MGDGGACYEHDTRRLNTPTFVEAGMSARDSITDGHTEKFGMMTVIGERRGRKGGIVCRCLCECGREKEYYRSELVVGRYVSCGCKRTRVGLRHGFFCGGKMPKSYTVWRAMIDRCVNEKNKHFPSYGGRGIRVCDRWTDIARGYANFRADMGEPGPGLTLDRRENEKGYHPDNCRWADRKTQQRNRRSNRTIEFRGRIQPLVAWAEETGLLPETIHIRLRRGWSVERALTTPAGRCHWKGE